MLIDLNIDSQEENNYKPFVIYKTQVLNLLESSGMSQSKKQDFIIALFAYVHGLTSLATMKNVHYSKKWENNLADLVKMFAYEF